MRSRATSKIIIAVPAVVTLTMALALSATAFADSSEDAADGRASALATAADVDALEDFNGFLRRTMFPELPADKCITGYLTAPGKPAWRIPIPCGDLYALKDVPEPDVTDMAPLLRLPATHLADRIAIDAALPDKEARAALAGVTGVAVGQLATMTGKDLIFRAFERQWALLGPLRTNTASDGEMVCADTRHGVVCRDRPAKAAAQASASATGLASGWISSVCWLCTFTSMLKPKARAAMGAFIKVALQAERVITKR